MTGPAGGSGPLGSGPIADEAVRLLEAARDWAHGFTAPGQAPPGSATTCQVCPFCQLLAAVRQVRPETFDHLADAARSVTLALRSMAGGAAAADPAAAGPDPSTAAGGPGPRGGSGTGRIQHIDIG